jgi:uncharacterized SAM-binding protein YcdF (DUF218 family)
VIVFVYLLFNVVSHESSYRPAPADAIVVLGHSIDSGDSTPDDWLSARLGAALTLYREDYADQIIVSGGRGPGDQIPVAQAMAEWFYDKGVSPDAVFTEEFSNNTAENFEFSKEIADDHDIKTIIVVTNDFHMYRSMEIASDYFSEISGCGAAVAFDFQKALAYLKEPLSILKYRGLHMIH